MPIDDFIAIDDSCRDHSPTSLRQPIVRHGRGPEGLVILHNVNDRLLHKTLLNESGKLAF
jgi:hypothetical protein